MPVNNQTRTTVHAFDGKKELLTTNKVPTRGRSVPKSEYAQFVTTRIAHLRNPNRSTAECMKIAATEWKTIQTMSHEIPI